MQPIHLTRATCLPIMQEAFRNNRLQAQQPENYNNYADCLYAGPCVVGVCLTPSERSQLDQPLKSIAYWINAGIVTTDDPEFFRIAQSYHDRAMNPEDNADELRNLAQHLEL